MKKSIIWNKEKINKSITRMAAEIVEKNSDMENVAILGIRKRGEFIAKRLLEKLQSSEKDLPLGILDVTFYRDDFRTNLGSPVVKPSEILFPLDNKDLILVDDVLYTGRTVRAALNEIFGYGRPRTVQLAVLVDRGHRELPISPDYVGLSQKTLKNEHIHVHVQEVDKEDCVLLMDYDGEE